MADIKDIHEGATVLGEFGIKVVGQVESSSDLPDPTEYDGEYGDAYVVGEEAPYDYYIFTRPFEDVDDPQWFNLGQFPAPGPQGETGETGATGATPAIVATATTSTLSAGQDASVTITKTGTDEEPHFTFAFEIPQGVQGVQGVQGAQGIQGPAGPQGIQGQKGDTGYLYTIIGQVNNESSLPLPGQVGRTSAFLVGTQEPYDVYIIIGQDVYDLEWLNIGPIATVVPTTYIASDTDASSGTLDATTLAAITNETGVHYMRVGSELFEYANTYNGNAYYMSLRYDGSVQMSKVARFVVALSSGAWTTGSDTIPDSEHTVFTNTNQTISGNKTFSGTVYIGDGLISINKNSFGNLAVNIANSTRVKISSAATQFATNLYPDGPGVYDIGVSGGAWKDLWLSGYLRDGTNSILISDIVTKATAQTITGAKTFRSAILGDGSASGSGLILKSDANENCTITLPKTGDGVTVAVPYSLTISTENAGDLSIGDVDGEETMNIYRDGIIHVQASGIDLYAWDGIISMGDLPTSDPNETDAIWNNSGVLMKSGSEGMPVFDPGIKVGTNIIGSIPFYSYNDGAATSSTITRDATIEVASGDWEFDVSVTFNQQGIIIGPENDLPFSSICAGYNFVTFPNAISVSGPSITEDEAFEGLIEDHGNYVTLRLLDSDEEMSYIVNDPNTTEWVIPTLAVKLKRNNVYYYIIQTPTDVDGPEATYDLTNIQIPSGYTLPDSGSRGLRIGIGGTAGGQINWVARYSGVASVQDY